MSFLQQFTVNHSRPEWIDEKNRKYRLIQTITLELLLLGVIFAYINMYLQLWFITNLLCVGIVAGGVNLWLLKKKYNLIFCGHIITGITLVLVSVCNLWFSGDLVSYQGWFYVIPIIAAATIGLVGLVIYSMLSAAVLALCISGLLYPIIIIPTNYAALLNNVNHVFIFLLIITTLYNLLVENMQYESRMREQNFLLYSDKQKFHYLSHHDFLTNLPNRSYFHHHLQSIIDSTNTQINTITLYFMDLDGFKKINDQYGHEVGDLLLLQASKRLQSCFREKDFIARLGGDEFTAAIVYNKNEKIAENLMRRIEKEFKEPFYIKNFEINCTISVGKANYPSDTTAVDTLIKMADDAMYKNKKKKYKTNVHQIRNVSKH